MKKTTLLSVLLLILATFVATSCSDDETAKKLNGKWEVTSGIPTLGEEGMTMTFVFNSSDMTGSMDFDVKAEGMDMMSMSIPYTWECTSSDITFKMEADKATIKFSDAIKEMAKQSGESLEEAEKQAKAELVKSMPNLGSNAITELTDTKLVMDDDGSAISCKRVK